MMAKTDRLAALRNELFGDIERFASDREAAQSGLVREHLAQAKGDESVAGPLKKSGIFPPLVTHMIGIGEKSGELEPMLVKVSEAYDNEVEAKIGALTALLTPVMILVMGGIVLFIVMAILLPIFELSQIVR